VPAKVWSRSLKRYNERMTVKPPSPKEQMIQLIQDQPDDSSFDQILRELAFARMVERGLADSDAGGTVDHDEMKQIIESWRK
jgi:hypothetical protein